MADDEEFCQASMKAILQKSGFDIVNRLDVCINGLEMLYLIKTAFAQGISYRLIFTDFSMPRMNGLEAVYQIKEFYKQKGVPVHD